MEYEVDNAAAAWVLMPSTEIEEVLQNVRMILLTTKGSVVLDRSFGVEGAMLDAPISVSQARMTAAIARAVKEQEPRARVQEVRYAGDMSDGHLAFTCVVEIIEKNLRGGVHL